MILHGGEVVKLRGLTGARGKKQFLGECAVCSVHCTLCTAHCALQTVHCALCTPCTVHHFHKFHTTLQPFKTSGQVTRWLDINALWGSRIQRHRQSLNLKVYWKYTDKKFYPGHFLSVAFRVGSIWRWFTQFKMTSISGLQQFATQMSLDNMCFQNLDVANIYLESVNYHFWWKYSLIGGEN